MKGARVVGLSEMCLSGIDSVKKYYWTLLLWTSRC